MMTMTILTADNDPPQCHNTINCIAMASPSLNKSIALKASTCSNDSQKNHPLTVLCKIPTRIFPFSQPDDAIDDHDNDNKRQPPTTHPHLSPTLNEVTKVTQHPSQHLATNNFVDRTLNEINKMMQTWPSPIAIKCNITSPDPCNPSSTPLPEHPNAEAEPTIFSLYSMTSLPKLT